VLRVEGLEVSYGTLQVLWGINLEVNQGEIVALIGANGAGKTTLLKSCVGQLRTKAGRILFQDKDITNMPTQKIVRMGLGLVPEGRHVFPDLTVQENLDVARYGAQNEQLANFGMEMAFELFPRLFERKFQKAGSLSGGEQQMMAVARALVSQPQLLLMDEPSLGLAPILVDDLFELIRKINERGVTIFLVEQNAFLALEFSDRTYILQDGKIFTEGLSVELLNSDTIREAYLGGVLEAKDNNISNSSGYTQPFSRN